MDFADPETAKKLLGCLTERQAVYMYLYYGEWLTMEDIGKLLSVDKSSICRTLERAAIRIQGCFPATAQCGVLDLGAIGDVLWTLYQQQEIKSLVPEYAQEAARRANTMQLQRCDAAGISPAVHDHYPEQSLWPSFEMEPCEENAAESLQYVPPLIQFPSKKKVLCSLVESAFSRACRTEQAALSAAGGKQAISVQTPQCLYLYALVFTGQRLFATRSAAKSYQNYIG